MKSNNSTWKLSDFFKSVAPIRNSYRSAHLLCAFFLLNSLISFAGNTKSNYPVASPSSESMRINLYLLNTNDARILADGVLTEYNDFYHDSVTLEDAHKFTNIRENLGLSRYGHVLAVERRPIISTMDTLFLNLWKTTSRNYQFEFESIGLDHPGMRAFLEDTYLGSNTSLALSGTTKINFSVNNDAASRDRNRFRIIYRENIIATSMAVNFNFVKTYLLNNKVSIAWKVENEARVARYEVERSANGTDFVKVNSLQVTDSKNAANSYSSLDISPVNGDNFYRIRSVDQEGSQKISAIVKVNNIAKSNTGSITIYPNPIRGNVVNLRFANQPAGVYQVRLINNSGQMVYSGSLSISSSNISQTIYTSKKLSGGIYQLEIKAPDNTINTQQAIVQE